MLIFFRNNFQISFKSKNSFNSKKYFFKYINKINDIMIIINKYFLNKIKIIK